MQVVAQLHIALCFPGMIGYLNSLGTGEWNGGKTVSLAKIRSRLVLKLASLSRGGMHNEDIALGSDGIPISVAE